MNNASELMRGKPFSMAAMISSVLFASLGFAQNQLGSNAALCYWQAFAEVDVLSQIDADLLSQADARPLDQQTRHLVNSGNEALRILHRGASMQQCAWGVDYDSGPFMLMPHLAKAKKLAQYACLTARHQMADKDAAAASQTVRDTLVFARHLDADTTVVSALVQHRIDGLVYRSVCRELPLWKKEQIDILLKAVTDLPAQGSLRDALQSEKTHFVRWLRQSTAMEPNARDLAGQINNLAEVPIDLPVTLERDTLSRWIDLCEADYAEALEIFALSGNEFEDRWRAFQKRVYRDNPFSMIVIPKLDRLKDAEQRHEVLSQLFRAALAVQRDGADALSRFKDPVTKKPFLLETGPTGFRLSSDISIGGERISLQVGI